MTEEDTEGADASRTPMPDKEVTVLEDVSDPRVQRVIDVLEERREVAIGLAVFLAAIVYALITTIRDGQVDVLETAIFAVIFGLVYTFIRNYFEE